MCVHVIHVWEDTLSDTLFEKAFKQNNYFIFFESKYTVAKLRTRTIQQKYKHIHENKYFLIILTVEDQLMLKITKNIKKMIIKKINFPISHVI